MDAVALLPWQLEIKSAKSAANYRASPLPAKSPTLSTADTFARLARGVSNEQFVTTQGSYHVGQFVAVLNHSTAHSM